MIKNGVNYSLFDQGKPLKEFYNRTIVGLGVLMIAKLQFIKLLCSSDLLFVFVGRVMDERLVADLEKLNNVNFNQKTPAELPGYVASFDVGIIPFRKMSLPKIYPK